jgi:hypothetical protein
MKMKPKFKNGDKVRDKISGLEGTITCVATYMNGCIRYSIQPGLDGDGHYQESEVIDEQQLEIIKPEKAKKKKPLGGDRPFQPKYKL